VKGVEASQIGSDQPARPEGPHALSEPPALLYQPSQLEDLGDCGDGTLCCLLVTGAACLAVQHCD
jgi:hypothetical protein